MLPMSRLAAATLAIVVLSAAFAGGSGNTASPVPPPATDLPRGPGGQTAAVFAGGCFWGVQAVFQHVKGVSSAVSGYAGGGQNTADYEVVSTGSTGHAESVKVTYDPAQVSYGQLLRIFFSVAHDPTELNRQGPDEGTQYRSAIFYSSPDQKHVAEAYIRQLDAAKAFPARIVTQVAPLQAFYPAEAYHQDYAARHPDSPYIVFNDAPKVERLRVEFPDMYRVR
jgi:peptide-methionine (S)-S-oxide reductase